MKPAKIHSGARQAIRGFSKEVRVEFGSALIKVQLGMMLGFPISRPMPSVGAGAYEMRFRDASGIQRVFYYVKLESAILVFHAFVKKTQQTPASEIGIGRKRLQEMLSDEKA
jgi:phage-related protein